MTIVKAESFSGRVRGHRQEHLYACFAGAAMYKSAERMDELCP